MACVSRYANNEFVRLQAIRDHLSRLVYDSIGRCVMGTGEIIRHEVNPVDQLVGAGIQMLPWVERRRQKFSCPKCPPHSFVQQSPFLHAPFRFPVDVDT